MKKKTCVVWLTVLSVMVSLLPVNVLPALSKPLEPGIREQVGGTLPAAPAAASNWCVAGDFQGWNNTSDPMYEDGTHGDLVANDNVFSLDFTVSTAGRHEWKVVACGNWGIAYPSSNSWFTTTVASQVVKFVFDKNTYSDGYAPATNVVNVFNDDSANLTDWTVIGPWQGWNNTDPTTKMTAIAPGMYALTRTFATAGTYEFKVSRTNDGNSQFANDGRATGGSGVTFSTTSADQVVTMFLDAGRGRIKAAVAGTPGTANWYLRGDMNGWSTTNPMYDDGTHGDLVSGDGIYSLDYTFATASTTQGWKIATSDWSASYPNNNAWLTVTAGQTVKFTLDTNTYNDGWWPASNIANANDDLPTTWTAVGAWQGWNNANPASAMSTVGPGQYAVTYTVTSPTNYTFKVVRTGEWEHQYGAGGRAADSQGGASEVNFQTYQPNQTVGFYLDTARGRVKVVSIPPTTHAIDGVIDTAGLYHNTRDTAYRTPFGPIPAGNAVTLRFRAYHNDLTGVRLRMSDSVLSTLQSYPMNLVATDGTYDYYEYTVPANHATIYWYSFVAMDTPASVFYGDESNWWNAPWMKDGAGTPTTDPGQLGTFQLTVYQPDYTTPDWLRNGTIYQIFPDRFRNDNPANDLPSGSFFYGNDERWGPGSIYTGTIAHTTWNEQIYDPRTNPAYLNAYSNQFYGGDLQGITDKINAGYFNSLGVTVLYLNPIFKSPSNHKYDTTDYTQIDPAFGTNQDFADLTQAAQAHGIHVVLDGVFNHSSSDSYYFDKYSRWNAAGGATPIGLNDGSGAYESITSTYFSWYFFNPWPTGYTAWAGYQSLPKLNSPNPLVRSFIYSGTNAIATRWIMSGSQQLASGWRFDVAGDIDSGYANDPTNGYWIGFRNAVRAVYSQTAMISEIWDNASAYLLGNQMDSTMNYRFRNALIGYVRDTGWSDTNTSLPHETASQFFETMRTMQEDYPAPAWYAMMNLVGSHDTNRLRFVIKESSDVTGTVDARQKLTALAQFSLPGAPTVYYADEVGASADGVACGSSGTCGDPYNRLPFPWDDTPGYYLQETGILTSYMTLGNARQANPALRTGSLDLLLADDTNNTLAYGRKLGTNVAIAVFNRQATSQQVVVNLSGYLAAGTVLTDVLTGNTYTPTAIGMDVPLTLTLSGNTGALLVTDAASAAPDVPFLSAPIEGNGEVLLNWTNTGATGYNVYRSLVSHGGYTRIATNTLTTAFTDTTVTNGTRYFYVVTALDAGLQESVYSNEVDARPHITIDWAGNLLPESIVHTIGLTPTEPITAQVYISGVTNLTGQGTGVIAQIGYGPTGTVPSSWSAWSPAVYAGDVGNNDVYSATLTPEVLGTLQYLARFSTTNGDDWVYAGLSGPIGDPNQATTDAGVLTVNPSSDTTPPSAPVLSLSTWNVDSIALTWTASTDPDDAVYAYDLHRSSATEPDDVIARILSPTLVYTDYTVISGLTYTYTVVALDTAFNASVPSNAIAAKAEQRLVEVTFNVTVPAFTPAGSTICIPGDNAKIMGSAWDPSTLPMTQVDATHWTRQITTTDGTQLQYKYTRCSSWNVVEWWGDIVGTANRHTTLNYGTNGQMVINDTVYNWRDPIVLDKSPLPGATGVQNNTVITASWSRPLNPSSLSANFTLATASGPVAGSTGFISSTAGYVSVFTPTGLLLGGVYTATLGTGITGSDNDGAGLQQSQTWNFAADPVSIAFVSPTNGQVFTATNGTSVDVPLVITTTNFVIPTDGHWHLWADGTMLGMVFGYTTTQTLLVGSHVITAELVNPSHQPLGPVATVNVVVNAPPAPSIAFVSPTNGQVFTATNGTSVDVPLMITTTNFVIPTDGHWHLWVDGTMLGMVFGYTTTQTLPVGSHVITAELVNPSHQPLGPVAMVNVIVKPVSVAFATLTNNQVFTATNGTSVNVLIQITTTNFAIPEDGYWQLWLDGASIRSVMGYTTTQTLLAGTHTVSAELRSSTNQSLGPIATVNVTVKPSSVAFVTPANNQVFTAMNGAGVNVPVQITTTNFVIPTDGNWHLWVDGTDKGTVTSYITNTTLLAGAHVITAELRSLANVPLGPLATVSVVVNVAGVAFVTPTNGQIFTATNNISVNVPLIITTTNFAIPADGRWQLWVDGSLISTVSGYTTTQTLLVGSHVISAALVNPAQQPLGPVATVTLQVRKIRPYATYLPVIQR